MDFIIDAITEWIKDFLIEAITGNLSNMFGDVNTKVATIAGEVGKTPEQWNSGVFSMIHSLSESVIVPIAGLVIAAVLSYELIRMVIDRNNMHDFDTFIFFKWIIKAGIAAYVVSHTFDFIIAIFEVAQTIAKRVNSTGNLYQEDVADMQERYRELWGAVSTLLGKLSDL